MILLQTLLAASLLRGHSFTLKPTSGGHSLTLRPTCTGVGKGSGRLRTPGLSAAGADDVISPLISGIAPSKTIEVHALTKEMQAKGEDIVSLVVGEPDFAPPPAVLEATIAAVNKGCTKYTGVTGNLELRQAICQDLSRRKNSTHVAENVVVSNGAKQAVYQAVLSVVRPGDEVIVPSPYWPSYPEIVKMAGGVPVIVETSAEEGFLLTPQALEKALTDRTRMIIFCNPSNPTGAVHDPQQCEELAAVLRKDKWGKVWILSDEIYERLTYNVEHRAFDTLPGMKDRTMLVNGFSKSHAMTGYRIGYLAAPPAIVKAVTTIQGQITSCASAISQEAALAALAVPDAEMQKSFTVMREKRDMLLEGFGTIPGIQVSTPQGAFYALPNISSYYGKTAPDGTVIGGATDFCLYFVREHKVALVTGEGFGYAGGVRFSYAASVPDIQHATQEFRKCLASLR